MKKKIKISLASIALTALLLPLTAAWAAPGADKREMDELDEGTFYTLHDIDSGEELEHLNRVCFEEDEIILSDNRRYKISKIEEDGYKAHCEQITDYTAPVLAQTVSTADAAAQNAETVAIYATHSDECYVPTSGTESKNGGGDILAVAGTIAEYLENEGIEVLHSENIHDPHDADAYARSRRTAAELLQSGDVDMIIDVHRDGVPDPEYYEEELDGEKVTQIRLVVGQANENSAENEAFAEQLKAYYDEAKPGLIKSIYIAKGSYNQDMAPHAVLLEVGTHTNTLAEAEAGARAFAEELPDFLAVMNGSSGRQFADNTPLSENNTDSEPTEKSEEKSKAWPIVWTIVILGAIAGGAYWYLKKDER